MHIQFLRCPDIYFYGGMFDRVVFCKEKMDVGQTFLALDHFND